MSYMRKWRNRNRLLNNLLDKELENALVKDTKIIDDFLNNPFKLRKRNITTADTEIIYSKCSERGIPISEFSVSQHIYINNVIGENEYVTIFQYNK